MNLEIHQLPRPADGWTYEYEITVGNRRVARYWHDQKGDEHGIDFVSGLSGCWPVGKMTDFLTGGGPQPLGLSDAELDPAPIANARSTPRQVAKGPRETWGWALLRSGSDGRFERQASGRQREVGGLRSLAPRGQRGARAST